MLTNPQLDKIEKMLTLLLIDRFNYYRGTDNGEKRFYEWMNNEN